MLALILGLVCIAIFLISALTGISSAGYELGTDLNALPDDVKSEISFFNPGLGLARAMVYACFGLAVVFGLFNFAKFPKASIKAAAALLAIVILFFILYSTSSMEETGKLAMLHDKFDVSEGTSKFISGGLKTTVIMALGAFIIMILAEIRNIFK